LGKSSDQEREERLKQVFKDWRYVVAERCEGSVAANGRPAAKARARQKARDHRADRKILPKEGK